MSSIAHLYHNGRPGPVDPLPPPSGAVILPKPLRLELGAWVPMDYDASIEVDGIAWLRVHGGRGDGQRTGWNPREDWAAMVPGVALTVGRYFSKPSEWRAGGQHADFFSAARAEVTAKLSYAENYLLPKARKRVATLERAVSLMARAQ